MISSISPTQLAELRRSGRPIELVDVRGPAEFHDEHVEFARNVPFDQLDPAELRKRGGGDAESPLYVICRAGIRSRQACERLQAAGLSNVVSVEGGTQAWGAAGLPVIRGHAGVSLERQVRIAAGLIVVVGSALSFLSPYFLVLPLFIGAGLAYSGITNTCGMARVLVQMPWNQREKTAVATCHQQT